MGKADEVSSIVLFILGLFIAYTSYRLGIGTLNSPGPGFVTFWCGIFLAALSVPVFIKGKKVKQASEEEGRLRKLWAGMKWTKSLYVILATLAYSLFFNYLGFILGSILLLIFLFRIIEPQKWVVVVGGAILASMISFLLFGVWLDVQFPRGILENLFF